MKICHLLISILLGQTFVLNADTVGTFTPVPGSPFATGSAPTGIAYSPVVSGGLFAAVTSGNDTVSVYSVNQTTGVLTQVAGSPFATGDLPFGIAYSPVVSGNLFVAVPNFADNKVSVYPVDQATGALLTQVAGSPFATGTAPIGIAYSPVVSGGLFIAITNLNGNSVSVYSVNQTTGVLTQVAAPFATGNLPFDVAYSPVVSGGLFAAVTNGGNDTVSVYSVDQTTGVFTPVAAFATGNAPNGIAYSPVVSGGLFAAVANSVDDTVSVYSVNQTTGAFTQVAGSPFAAGDEPTGIAFSSVVSGNLLAAVANVGSDTVSVYSVNQTTGAFTQVAGSPFATGDGPTGIAFSSVVSGNLFAAVTNRNATSVSVYKVTTFVPPSITVAPPSDLTGCKTRNVFLLQSDLINIVSWSAPITGTTPVSYYIYRDAALTDLAGIVSASGQLRFVDHNRLPNIFYTYYIVSVDQDNNISSPASITVTQNC